MQFGSHCHPHAITTARPPGIRQKTIISNDKEDDFSSNDQRRQEENRLSIRKDAGPLSKKETHSCQADGGRAGPPCGFTAPANLLPVLRRNKLCQLSRVACAERTISLENRGLTGQQRHRIFPGSRP